MNKKQMNESSQECLALALYCLSEEPDKVREVVTSIDTEFGAVSNPNPKFIAVANAVIELVELKFICKALETYATPINKSDFGCALLSVLDLNFL